jgi:hypothetical protein
VTRDKVTSVACSVTDRSIIRIIWDSGQAIYPINLFDRLNGIFLRLWKNGFDGAMGEGYIVSKVGASSEIELETRNCVP